MYGGCVTGYGIGDYGTVCLTTENELGSSIHGELMIETSDPIYFYKLYKCMKKYKRSLETLVDIYLEYDVPQFISSHTGMTRRVQRLRKLLRILDEITCPDTYVVKMSDILRPVVERLRPITDTLLLFKDSVHRLRDKVYTYTLPAIQQLLEIIKDTWIIVLPIEHGTGAELVAEIGDEPRIYITVERPDMMRSRELPEKAIERIIRKSRNKFDRCHELRIIAEKIYKRTRKKYEQKPLDYIPRWLFKK